MSSSARVWFHDRLDRLLDETNMAKTQAVARAAPAVTTYDAERLLQDGLGLLTSVLGDDVLGRALDRPSADPRGEREQVIHWVRAIFPLLHCTHRRNSRHLSPFDLIGAIAALEAGEVQPIFQAAKGRNRKSNRWTLAHRKLDALVWAKRLVALGWDQEEARKEVADAFGVPWDTIRHWDRQCASLLGASVAFAIESAGGRSDPYLHETGGFTRRPRIEDWQAGLARSGELYRDELKKGASRSKRRPSGVSGTGDGLRAASER